jgi:hypothetical protein
MARALGPEGTFLIRQRALGLCHNLMKNCGMLPMEGET